MNMNPKALNLDAIRDSDKKITLGFKCSPALKIQLAQEAEENGLTLSSYTEALIESAEQFISKKSFEEIKKLTKSIEEHKKKIDFYEAPLLKKLLQDFKDKEISFSDSKGDKTTIKINTIEDVFTIIIQSFKPSKK